MKTKYIFLNLLLPSLVKSAMASSGIFCYKVKVNIFLLSIKTGKILNRSKKYINLLEVIQWIKVYIQWSLNLFNLAVPASYYFISPCIYQLRVGIIFFCEFPYTYYIFSLESTCKKLEKVTSISVGDIYVQKTLHKKVIMPWLKGGVV